MNFKKMAILSTFTVFLVGLAMGFALNQMVYKSKSDRRHRSTANTVAFFTKELELTEIQQQKLKGLLDKVKNDYSEIRKKCSPEYRRVREEFRKSFSEILNEEQKEKFEEFNQKEHQKERK